MRRSLRNRLLVSYFVLVALFGGGVVLTLLSVRELGERTERLVDQHWQASRLITAVHSLLGEVALYVTISPEAPEAAAAQRALQERIDQLMAQFSASNFPGEFRDEQIERLRQLKSDLAGPVEVLIRLEHQNQQADEALLPLLAEAERRGRRDVARDLTIAALAYRDYYITANPSDLEIFRRQIDRLAQLSLSPVFAERFAVFREHGEEVFAQRLRLRASREQIVDQIRRLSGILLERTEAYAQHAVYPVRAQIQRELEFLPGILLAAVIVSGLVALTAALLLARGISVPMERAAVALRRIEQGDLDARIGHAGNEEVDLLGRAVNSLAVSLKQTLHDLHQTVERLRESEENYRLIAEQRLNLERIINASPTIAFLCGIDDGYPLLFASESLGQFGYRPHDLTGRSLAVLDLIDPGERPRVAAVIAEHLASPEDHEFFQEFRIVTRDGERRWVDCRMQVRRNAAGEATHLQGVMLDITEKIRLREQTAQASRLASLGELAAGVAHEINNPNATILLNSTVLRELGEGMLRLLDELWRERGELPLGRMPYARLREEIPRLQAEVLESAGRIRRIVEDLKEFASAPPPEFRQAVDLNAVAMVAIRLAGNVLKKSTDRFEACYAEDLPAVDGHAQRLEQVVMNLLMNACQALPERQRAVRLETSVLAEEGAVCLTVADEGRGIAPDSLPHVTDPFFTTRRDQGGTGLGLSVSARIVKEHGGRLEITSNQGEGTVVRVILPLPKQEPSA